MIIVKGNKQQSECIREQIRQFLEGDLLLTMNIEKTHITHVDDGFIFLDQQIIRKHGPRGVKRSVTTISHDKMRSFARSISDEISGNYGENKIFMIEKLNRKFAGWATFYQFTDYTSSVYRRIDRILFWKLAHWLA